MLNPRDGTRLACDDGRMSGMSGSTPVQHRQPAVKLTYDDFVRFPDDGQRHELIDGAHHVTPSPSTRHQRISGNLHLLIGNWLEVHPIGQIFYAPYDVVLSNIDVVEPDLMYLSNERADQVLTSLHAKGVPELVIEIASKGTRRRDATTKLRLYERVGVTEYWVVEPDGGVVRVYRRTGDRFDRPVSLAREVGDVLTTTLVPGLELPLLKIFKD